MKKLYILTLFLLSIGLSAQEQYRSPMDIPLLLSANFGELRPNHFHTGIDIKTQGVINKPVYAIADGYISRISVSPSGYGLALYIDHPGTGHTSQYGHLEKFTPAITKYVKEEQYKQESYRINLYPDAEMFPVKKGDLIAYSGNTGSSGGPHVHFEIRDTKTENAIDPLVYYKKSIEDTQAPLVKGIAVYPIEGQGVLNGDINPYRQNIIMQKKGGYSPISKPLEVWGRIGVGVKANDRMSKTANIYGVKIVKLYCDDNEIWSYDMTAVDFSLSRMINSFIDYDYWVNEKSYYMKSFIEPGNKLPLFKAENDGYIDVNEERSYNLRYELIDLYGNKTSYKFTLKGKKQDIPAHRPCSQAMVQSRNNYYLTDDLTFIVPGECLYTDICFNLSKVSSGKHYSDIYTLHDAYVPLYNSAKLKLKLKSDTLSDKSQYGIVSLRGGKEYWTGGTYADGHITADINRLGDMYAVGCDTISPKITPVQPEKWVTAGKIKIKLQDDKSGIKTFKGTIDDAFVLFEHDVKSSVYTYTLDPARIGKGKSHVLKFIAVDGCGNKSSYEYTFKY